LPNSSASARTPSASYPNYRPHSLVLLAHIVAFVLIAAVVFGPPDKGVGIISIASEGEYVGLMRSCSAGTCSDWFATGERDCGTVLDTLVEEAEGGRI
jgi:hypothetical protein